MKRILFAMFLLLGCLSIHAESNYQSFDPKTEGEVLIYEKDWQGVEYSGGWVEWASGDTETFWAAKGTDEGLAITVHTKQGQIWQPQVMVVPDAFPLEAGHDYIVRLTLKVPSDGIYKVVLGDWGSVDRYVEISETPSDEWQEIDVEFSNYYTTISNALVYILIGDVVGTTILKKVQVYEKLKGGETAIKTIKAPNAEGTIYNLAGQKVDASYKGIVIQNGKKRIAR